MKTRLYLRLVFTSYTSSTPSVYWSRLGRFWALFRESKGFLTTIQQNFSIGNTPCVICTSFIIDLWMITLCLYTPDYPGQQFATNVQNGVVGWSKNSVHEWLFIKLRGLGWITLDNNSQRIYKVASLVGQWRSKNSVHRWLFIKFILKRNFAAISWNHWHWRQRNRLTRQFSFDWRW